MHSFHADQRKEDDECKADQKDPQFDIFSNHRRSDPFPINFILDKEAHFGFEKFAFRFFRNSHFVLRISGVTGLGYYNELFACRGNQSQLLFGNFGNSLGRF